MGSVSLRKIAPHLASLARKGKAGGLARCLAGPVPCRSVSPPLVCPAIPSPPCDNGRRLCFASLFWVFHAAADAFRRSEEHTSELQSLMRISYAVFCLKKKNKLTCTQHSTQSEN